MMTIAYKDLGTSLDIKSIIKQVNLKKIIGNRYNCLPKAMMGPSHSTSRIPIINP